ncbi:MAG: peptide chain release factor N(5)-glutamine methyltransferase [Anaerolineae bacterium]
MLIARPESIQEVLVSGVRALGVRMEYRYARFEAELLMAHAMGLNRAGVLARLADPLDAATTAQFAGMVARRAQGEPIAYILGHKEFYGLDLLVDRRVLIPRPETELLVELALHALVRVSHPTPVVADVGTGSGGLALALASKAPSARVVATDISPDALAVAQLNAGRLNLADRVQFILCDLLEAVGEPLDIVLANLPYIPLERFDQLPHEIRHFEPRLALVGGLEGLSVIRRLLQQVEAHMTRAGIILLEISEEQGENARALAARFFPNATITVHRDLEELDRVVEIQLAGT